MSGSDPFPARHRRTESSRLGAASPRRSPRPGWAVLSCAVLASGLAALPGPGRPSWADDGDRPPQTIQRSIAGVRDDLAETSRNLSDAVARLERMEGELALARAAVTKARGDLAVARAQETSLTAALAAAASAVSDAEAGLTAVSERTDETREDVDRIARAAYQQGPMSTLSLYLRAETPQDLVARVAYTRSVARSTEAALAELGRQRGELTDQRTQLAAKQADIGRLRAQAASNVSRLRELETQVSGWQGRVQRLAAAARVERVGIERRKSDEQARLTGMEKEARALQVRLRARAGSRGWKGDGLANLSLPSTGHLTSPFGMRLHPITHVRKLHDGLDFAAPCSAPVYAAASGFVLESRLAEGWGNRIVVEHGIKRGRAVAAAYNHLTERLVGDGDYVYRGQVIATIGSTGLSTGCHLHFTVYADGDAVDPMDWLR